MLRRLQSQVVRLNRSDAVAIVLAAAFTITFFVLNNQKYLAFDLLSPDVDQFSQAIWNTLHGRFLLTTITNGSILGFHFSPYLALLSPLLLIWSDIRILFLAQTISVAVTGLILFKIAADRHRSLAPWFLLAFYLSASVHLVTLHELRRVTFAMPFLALMVYGLYKDNKWLMLLGIFFALLAKEDIGLIVAMAGFFLIVIKHDWKWGAFIMVLGLGWALAMILWVIPAVRGGAYNQLNYFAEWGDSPAQIVSSIFSNPLQVLQKALDRDGLLALGRLFLPLAIVLPFLAPEYAVIAFPLLGLMLLSSEPEMHEFRRWYLAPVIPILFGAIAVGLNRLSAQKARWAVLALLAATLAGYFLFSEAPFGGEYEPERYQIGHRQRLAWEMVESIPDEAIVASQVPFIAALSQREHIYLYPWYAIGEENIDYFLVARGFDSYPVPSDELDWSINNLIANSEIVVEQEADGIYLLHQGGEPLPGFEADRVAEEAIKLDRFEAAVADEKGFFQPVTSEPASVTPGQVVRVTLYWAALADMDQERTVSVRIQDAAGALVAQQDMMPVQGSRPTSWWEPGWYFRDVYYLALSPAAAPGPGRLDLVLYDSFSAERISFDDGDDVLRLLDLEIVPPAVSPQAAD